MLTPANAGQIQAHHGAWVASHPTEHAALQATLAAGGQPLLLPAIHDRLETCFYASAIPSPDTMVVVHELEDRMDGGPVYVAWSRSGSRPLAGVPAGTYSVMDGDGGKVVQPSSDIVLTESSVLLEPSAASAVADPTPASGVRVWAPVPNPGHDQSQITFAVPAATEVEITLIDVSGRAVRELGHRAFGAGLHAVRVDASGLPAGVYLVRVRANGHDRTVRWAKLD